MIAEQDRGTAAPQCADDCIESWSVNMIQRLRALEPIGELIERRLLANARREGVLDATALGEIMQNTQRIEEPAVGIANARRGYRRPHIGAVLPADALLDGVAIELACDLAPKLRTVRLNVLVISLLEDRAAQQFLRRVSCERARLRIHAQELAVRIHFPDANVLIDPVLPGAGVNRRRKLSDKIRTRRTRSGAGNVRDSARCVRGKFIDAHLAPPLAPGRHARIRAPQRRSKYVSVFLPPDGPIDGTVYLHCSGREVPTSQTEGRTILRHCSRVSAALQPRFRGIAAAFRNHAKRIAVFICECEAVPRVSHVSFRCKACAQEHLGGDVGRALPNLRQLGSTICCTVFDVPPSGGGLKTWIETARYPMMPVFCTGPGAK